MGIQGLLPFLKTATRPANVKEFTGCTVAVDAYCWLHKGAFSCAERLVKGEKTDGYVYYCIKLVNSLLAAGVRPVLVFDGQRLPLKEITENKRHENRRHYREKAKRYLIEGKLHEARECFQRCVEVTSAMAIEVIQACRKIGVDCIVAPYEADAQLAYLNKIRLAQLVITEDSDLVLFGCDRILFKMDGNGNGMLLDSSKLPVCFGMRAEQFTFEKFRHMCIMSGCDYLPSLPGIGLQKSFKFFSKITNPDLNIVLSKIPIYLNMPKVVVTSEYKRGFQKASDTFLYQLVFDPLQRKLLPLNPYPDHLESIRMDYAGPTIPNEIAFQIAVGNINVDTMQRIANFDPDRDKVVVKSTAWNSAIKVKSIWDTDYKLPTEHRPPPGYTSPSAGSTSVQSHSTAGAEIIVQTPKMWKRRTTSNLKRSLSDTMDNEKEQRSLDRELMTMYLDKKPKMEPRSSPPKSENVVYSKYFPPPVLSELTSTDAANLHNTEKERALSSQPEFQSSGGSTPSELGRPTNGIMDRGSDRHNVPAVKSPPTRQAKENRKGSLIFDKAIASRKSDCSSQDVFTNLEPRQTGNFGKWDSLLKKFSYHASPYFSTSSPTAHSKFKPLVVRESPEISESSNDDVDIDGPEKIACLDVLYEGESSPETKIASQMSSTSTVDGLCERESIPFQDDDDDADLALTKCKSEGNPIDWQAGSSKPLATKCSPSPVTSSSRRCRHPGLPARRSVSEKKATTVTKLHSLARFGFTRTSTPLQAK